MTYFPEIRGKTPINTPLHFSLKEEIIGKNFKVLDFQSLFANLFQIYPKFLIISEPGTGKTLTFIEASHKALENGLVKNVIILSRSKILSNNVIFELSKRLIEPFDEKFVPNIKSIKNYFKDRYIFSTFTKFFNKYRETNEDDLKEEFSNSLFIFDEVHKLLVMNTNNSFNTKEIEFYIYLLNFLECPLILASATPVSSSPKQIDYLTRLMGLRETKGDYSFQNIKSIFLNYTFFKAFDRDDSVEQRFISQNPKCITSKFKSDLYFSEIKGTQLDSYKYYELPENSGGGYRTNIIQASSFVFPDGSIGGKIDVIEEDEEEVLSENINEGGLTKYAEDISKFYTTPGVYQFKNNFKGDLSDLSAKMSAIVDIELENNKVPGTCFIYTGNMKNGGGSILMGLVLERYGGFNNYLKTNKLSPKTYVCLNTEMTEEQKNKILNIFRSDKNIDGSLIKIIIGTSQLKEGVSFFHCVRVHLLNRAWTYSEDVQSIGRSLRKGSHSLLKEKFYKNSKVFLNVYKHASYYCDEKGHYHSVDDEIENINKNKQPELDEIMKGLVEASINISFKNNKSFVKEEDKEENEDEENEIYFKKDLFSNTLSKLPFDDININSKIEHSFNSKYIEKIDKNTYLNTYLYKNSIEVYGKYNQHFINRIRLNRIYINGEWNYLFFYLLYNNISYKENFFDLLNNFNTSFNIKNNDKELIDSFYEKNKIDFFGLYNTEEDTLKIVNKKEKKNNLGKNALSYSKEELDIFYKSFTKSKDKKIYTKEFYKEELTKIFKKNKILIIN